MGSKSFNLLRNSLGSKSSNLLRSSVGSKRLRRSSAHKGGYYTDRISVLPDDIIILILSYLSLKDSVVTSSLSRRWRHMWAWASRLDFVPEDWTQRYNAYTVKRRCNRFVKEVNQVLSLHKPSTLEEFSISFDLNEKLGRSIDNWLKFALAKRVQRLKLDFHIRGKWDAPFVGDCDSEPYMLSCGMLGQTNGTSVGFESLKVLCLRRVNVTGEVLEGCLSSCPSLEKLSINGSKLLVSFKVCGPSLVLKDLEIIRCQNLTSVEICNTNLATLTFRGRKIRWVIRDVPMLVELTIGSPATWFLDDLFTQLSCCLPQLETLTLETYDREEFKGLDLPLELSNLKKLVLKPLLSIGDFSFLGYTTFIKASPLLKRFVFQARWCDPCITARKIRRLENFQHQHIEEVELSGYYGRTSDLELLTFFLENVASLKKIVVCPRSYEDMDVDLDIVDLRKEKAARRRTLQQLKGIKNLHGIEIKIL